MEVRRRPKVDPTSTAATPNRPHLRIQVRAPGARMGAQARRTEGATPRPRPREPWAHATAAESAPSGSATGAIGGGPSVVAGGSGSALAGSDGGVEAVNRATGQDPGGETLGRLCFRGPQRRLGQRSSGSGGASSASGGVGSSGGPASGGSGSSGGPDSGSSGAGGRTGSSTGGSSNGGPNASSGGSGAGSSSGGSSAADGCSCTGPQRPIPTGVNCGAIVIDGTVPSGQAKMACKQASGFVERTVPCGQKGTYVTCDVALGIAGAVQACGVASRRPRSSNASRARRAAWRGASLARRPLSPSVRIHSAPIGRSQMLRKRR